MRRATVTPSLRRGALRHRRSAVRQADLPAQRICSRSRWSVVAPLFLIISADAPFKTLPELIAYGKSKPDGLTFASPGAGSQPHLAGELLFRDAGVKGLNIPFRGDAASYTELLAGRVDATLTALPTALPYIQSGKFTVLGVASAERSALYPQAPTLRERGLSQRGRRRLVRLHGAVHDAARDRRQAPGRGSARARRARDQGQADRPGPRSARRHGGRVRPSSSTPKRRNGPS